MVFYNYLLIAFSIVRSLGDNGVRVVCMYVFMHVCMYASMYVLYISVYVCIMHACICVCMHVSYKYMMHVYTRWIFKNKITLFNFFKWFSEGPDPPRSATGQNA